MYIQKTQKESSNNNQEYTVQSGFSDLKFSDNLDLVTIFQRPFFNILHKIFDLVILYDVLTMISISLFAIRICFVAFNFFLFKSSTNL